MLPPLAAALVASLLVSAGAWQVPGRPLSIRGARQRLVSKPLAVEKTDDDDDVVFTFGDAVAVSEETEQALEGEERQMTEKEKEIARLRAAEKFMKKDTGNALCRTCGYKYKWEDGAPGLPKRTPFELVPESWACPNCKSPKAFFDPEQVEIAGFEDNQTYGFGTNTWTEAQKSNAIFGGLAFFFLLLLSGYALN